MYVAPSSIKGNVNLIRTLFVLGLLAFLPILFTGRTANAAPPEDFQSSPVITSGLDGPSGFEIAPDGRIFILQRTGEVKIYKDGALLEEPFTVLPSVASGDRGLIGIAFDPDFEQNYYVYFYYTGEDQLNRLVRFEASTDVGQNGPYLLYQTSSPSQELHVGGSVQFGSDGKLYLAIGDNGYPPNAQDLSNPHGKILRINRDGTVPEDNPFVGEAGALPEIWAYGFRNPWRFQFDTETDKLYGGDVGDFNWEEVNHIVKGGNYGWPEKEGICEADCDGFIDPIYAYNHNGESAAVTGGPVYRGVMFPEAYRGSLFFSDYAMGFIKYIPLADDGSALDVLDFDTNAGSVVDMKVAPDGSMYYLTYYPGRLYRVTYDEFNRAPTANATADVTNGLDPLTVNFSSTGSSDPDDDPLTYLWDFGDGTTSTEANPTKIYEAKGAYTVDLTVSDGTYQAQASPIVIQVGNPPSVRISAPSDGATYRAGDMITVNIFGEDSAGFDLNDANLSTDVILHHGTHTHPFLDNLIGRSHTFTIPTTGEASADTWYEIIATATDDNGLYDTKSVYIYPVTTDLTFDTSVPGLDIKVDGVPYTTPYSVEGVVGFERELTAQPIVRDADGVYYQFDGWSDGGAIRHFITTPDTPATYTANYSPAPAFNAEYFNNTDLSGEPVITRQDPVIDFTWEGGSPDPLVQDDQFSARWTKDQFFAAGNYKFSVASDDGFRLFIDGVPVLDEWADQNASHSVVVELTEGMHEIKMEYYDAFGFATARLNWDTTTSSPTITPGNMYDAEYFDNMTLAGTPVVSRQDSTIDFDWGGGSPDPAVPLDGFSARWTRTVNLEAGTYEFTATADDGVRVYIDDELLIDQWVDQGPTTYTAEKTLTAGDHTIRVEYYENGGGAVMQFGYEKVADPAPSGYAAEFWNVTEGGSFVIPDRPADVSRNDEAIDFEWGSGSPDPVISPDYYVAKWTKTQEFEAGTYRFTTTSDDGIRVYLDGVLVMDYWIDQAPTTYIKDIDITAGPHEIVVEYYENAGGAVAAFDYELVDPVPAPASEYTAEFWNLPPDGVYPPEIPLVSPDISRTDTEIDFSWGGGSPDPAINSNGFAARWTKTVELAADTTYEFVAEADDGVRVLVDGVPVIDGWKDQATTMYVAQQTLAAGTRTITVEYYERWGSSGISFTAAPMMHDHGLYEVPDGEPAPAVDLAVSEAADGGYELALDTTNFTFVPVTEGAVHVHGEGHAHLFVDGVEVGRIHTPTTTIPRLNPDQHEIKVSLTTNDHRVYAVSGVAVEDSVLINQPLDPSEAEYTAEYWNLAAPATAPEVPAAPADVVWGEDSIDHDWGGGSPATMINPDGFVARWTKTATLADGTYRFTTTSDDGIRVYVNDELVIDQWNDHAPTVHTGDVALVAGDHDIRIEYYENGGGAVARFEYELL